MSKPFLILVALSAVAALISCGIVISQPKGGYGHSEVADSCGTSERLSIHTSSTLSELWEHQASQMLAGVSTGSDYREQIHDRVASIGDSIGNLCSGPKLQVHTSEGLEHAETTTLCIHEFELSEIGAPASVLNSEPLLLLHQRSKEDSVRWLPLGSSIGSRTSAVSVSTRRLSPLDEDTTFVWLEIEKRRTDFRSQDPKTGKPTIKVETEREAYALSIADSSIAIRLAKFIPLMHETTYGHEADAYVDDRREVDAQLIDDVRLQISAQSDSLTQMQTCQLGVHDLTSN